MKFYIELSSFLIKFSIKDLYTKFLLIIITTN